MFAASVRSTRTRVVFGQYDGYRDEEDVADDSDVETFVAIEAAVDNDRWRDVPFFLRTGKAWPRAGARSRSASATRLHWWAASGGGAPGPNELILELTDEPQDPLDMRAKQPGPDMELARRVMRLDLVEDFPDDDPLEAYERLILDVLRGDLTLFTRADEVDGCGKSCQPVLDDRPGAAAVRAKGLGTPGGPRPSRGRLAARQPRTGQVAHEVRSTATSCPLRPRDGAPVHSLVAT